MRRSTATRVFGHGEPRQRKELAPANANGPTDAGNYARTGRRKRPDSRSSERLLDRARCKSKRPDEPTPTALPRVARWVSAQCAAQSMLRTRQTAAVQRIGLRLGAKNHGMPWFHLVRLAGRDGSRLLQPPHTISVVGDGPMHVATRRHEFRLGAARDDSSERPSASADGHSRRRRTRPLTSFGWEVGPDTRDRRPLIGFGRRESTRHAGMVSIHRLRPANGTHDARGTVSPHRFRPTRERPTHAEAYFAHRLRLAGEAADARIGSTSQASAREGHPATATVHRLRLRPGLAVQSTPWSSTLGPSGLEVGLLRKASPWEELDVAVLRHSG